MFKRIVFRHMDHSNEIEEHANKHLAKIEHFLEESERDPIYIDLIFEPSKTREHHKIELRVKSPNYDIIEIYEHQGIPFYDALDIVINKMHDKLHEKKRLIKKDEKKMVGRHDEFKKQR